MMEEHDLLLGRASNGSLIWLPGFTPVVLHAPSGTGKTADFEVPQCFAWQGSAIILDVKRELFAATAGYRASMGQEIYLFEPASREGRSHRWDPFASVQRKEVSRFREVARVANLIFPEIDQIGSGSNNSKFWDDKGRQSVSAVATLLAESPEERLTMNRLAQVFTRADGHEWLMEQIALRRRAGDPYSAIAVDGVSDYIGDDPKLRGDIRATVSTRFQTWFQDPQIAAATATSDFDLADLRRKPMTIYLSIAPGDIPRLRPLLRLFFDQAIVQTTSVTPEDDPSLVEPVMFLLPEFARLGRVDSLAQAAQYARGYGARMVYSIQDKHQLKAIYGEEGTQDILSNVGAEVVFGITDLALAQEVEARLGSNTTGYAAQNRPRFLSWLNLSKQSESVSPHRRPLLLTQELLRMRPDEQLILRRGMLPIKSGRVRWFMDKEFKSRFRSPPPVPLLRVEVARDDGTTTLVRSRRAER